MEEAITALLANVAGGRRHWVRAPQDTARPFVVLNRISGVRDYHMQGASGYVASRLQVDIYADTHTAAKATARQVRDALSGRRGSTIQGIFLDMERDLPAEDAGAVTHLFRVSLDFNVHHTEGN
jgi:hypothetical protein